MEQKIVKRRLVVGAEVESYLAKVFGCSYRMIKKAMYLSEKSDLARRIQKAAREKGAYVELSAPECDTFHFSDGKMVQVFDNGAVLEVAMQTGHCIVTHHDKVVEDVDVLTIPQLEQLQHEIAQLK